MFSNDREDPAQKAARKIDWEFFLASLTVREKSVVEGLLAGLNGSEIARKFGLTPSTIQYFKERLALKILEHFGPDILVVVRRSPKWRDNLNASKERLACKFDRRN